MKILFTGSTGFIGSKAKAKLISKGHEVIDFDITLGNSILDLEEVENAVKGADVVYHLAAEADLTRMQELEGGRKGAMTNMQGTHNIAYACAKYNKWLIYGSTVCVYGNQEVHPETEDSTLPNPSELYAYTKYAGELLVKGYSKNYGNPFTILRFATIYGEGMREALGLCIFFRQAIAGQPITVHGDGQQIRTLTYIHDLVEGIVSVIGHPESQGQTINLSSKVGVSALKMAEDIKALTGSKSDIVFIPQRQNQTFTEDFDVSKSKNLLGWEAKTEWNQGLIETLEWIRSSE